MNLVFIELVKTLNKLIAEYNENKATHNINDILKFEFYVRAELSEAGVTIQEVNKAINN